MDNGTHPSLWLSLPSNNRTSHLEKKNEIRKTVDEGDFYSFDYLELSLHTEMIIID